MDSLGQGFSEGTVETACLCLIMSGAKLEDSKSGFGTTSGLAQSHIWWLLSANWDHWPAHLHSVSLHVLVSSQYGGWGPRVSVSGEWVGERARQKHYRFLRPSFGSLFCCALLVRMTEKINREQQRPHLLKEACHPYIVGYIVVWPSLENLICNRSEWQGQGGTCKSRRTCQAKALSDR